jgi:hypothetical protein
MALLCPAGSATRNAIYIGVHNYWLIRPALSATRTASRSGPILEMAIFAAPLEVPMAEVEDMHFQTLPDVITMLLIMVIRMSIIQNSGVKFISQLLTQYVLQVIQTFHQTGVDMMEVALSHTCQE